MTKYEMTFILEPGLDEARVNEEIDRVSGWIQELDGVVNEVQRWGKRRLSYEIRHRRDGIYTMIVFEGAGGTVKELERRLKLNESVMRVLTVDYVPPELTRPQTEEGEGDSDRKDRDKDKDKPAPAKAESDKAPAAGKPAAAASEATAGGTATAGGATTD